MEQSAMESVAYNPNLVPWERPAPNNVAGKGHIEKPGHVTNIVWQTRAAAPSAYENALGDALEAAFAGGAKSPEDVVRAFNHAGFLAADGQSWTEDRFLSEMRRLGA
ncbi:recombinase-like helix-turn-helix domain-containing protein [Ralstonia sp. 25mfcol4.1]|uniref:recombinase-like helix-turn-helix domain-containing protein n=1 Tax=Ralstonia sp. 25mfcol4.1 TaxID=1761899 RepID=UPI000B88A809|nr:recombinase-like helix-turn-helix domain-containing protein [Ralstonia sp. 25mfcol4.1]